MDGPEPVLRLDYAPGRSLQDGIVAGKYYDLLFVVASISQIAHALGYAHNLGIVHGNLKPQNILFGEQDKILLSDFDVPISPFLQSASVLSRLPYHAPEQDSGNTLPASDQYQLACLAYDWLRNWRDSSQDSPIMVSAILQVLERARSDDYKQRYPRIQDFAQALERAYAESAGKLPTSAPLSIHPPMHRRISLVWSTVTVFLLTLLVGSGLLIGQSVKQHVVSALTPTALTAMDPQALYTSVMHTRPTLENPSAGDGANQWSLTSDRFGDACTFDHGTVNLAITSPSSVRVECSINALTVQSFAIRAEMRFLRIGAQAGDLLAGLLMREDITRGAGYNFYLDTAFYACNFALHFADVQSKPCPSRSGVGDTNVLTVIALQDKFCLYINNIYVRTINDNHYQSGSLGIFLGGDTPNLDVAFNNVKVWTL